MPTGPLKELSGPVSPQPNVRGYDIIRYWHPESGKSKEFIKQVYSLKEAQTHCSDPSTHCNTGPAQDQFFDGYAKSSSQSAYITPW